MKTPLNPQYDPDRHSLLKNIFTYRYKGNYLGYIIREEATNSLICIDPGDFEIGFRNIQLLELEYKSSLKHIFCTHHHDSHVASSAQFKKRYPDLEIIIGNYGKTRAFHTRHVEEIQPFQIGDLSICLFHTPGHTDDSCTFIVHHVTPSSTKTPVAFTGDTLYVGSCGKIHTNDYGTMLKSLNKLKTLPNETLIFPGHDNGLHNLTWIKTLDPKNPFVKFKLLAFERFTKENGFCVPSILSDEKKYNPFLRSSEKYYSDLLNEKDPVKALTKLKKAQEMMFNL